MDIALQVAMKDPPRFIKRLEAKGVRASVVSIDHLDELAAEIIALHDKGLYPDDVFRAYGRYFRPKVPRNLAHAQSIIVVATPQPILNASFEYHGRAHAIPIPPTYFDDRKIVSNVRRVLLDAFKPDHPRLVRAVLPAKLLAVRSGLAMYGKNNITYVQGIGSMYKLVAFYSDYRSPFDAWQEKRALPECSKCRACTKACPTGAISDDRFQVHIERCVTFWNEKKSADDFPDWIGSSAHNCLVGCMRCQLACPQNRPFLGQREERGHFSEAETEYLLKGEFSGARAKKMERKLKRIGVDLTIFPRNLEALLSEDR